MQARVTAFPESIEGILAKQSTQLAAWESSGKKAEWEAGRALEQLTVTERIAFSHKIICDYPSAIWLRKKTGNWVAAAEVQYLDNAGMVIATKKCVLPDDVLEVSFRFTDSDGNEINGSGKHFHIRKALVILEQQKQCGKWQAIELIPQSRDSGSVPGSVGGHPVGKCSKCNSEILNAPFLSRTLPGEFCSRICRDGDQVQSGSGRRKLTAREQKQSAIRRREYQRQLMRERRGKSSEQTDVSLLANKSLNPIENTGS